eukprot:scaffold4516_cov417-Prasinococcus_capsulatus_cf.AAC.3
MSRGCFVRALYNRDLGRNCGAIVRAINLPRGASAVPARAISRAIPKILPRGGEGSYQILRFSGDVQSAPIFIVVKSDSTPQDPTAWAAHLGSPRPRQVRGSILESDDGVHALGQVPEHMCDCGHNTSCTMSTCHAFHRPPSYNGRHQSACATHGNSSSKYAGAVSTAWKSSSRSSGSHKHYGTK